MTDATGFADDTTAISVGPDPAICRDMVQEAVDLAIRWGEDNGLTFNASKTVVIQFKKEDFAEPRPIKVKGEPVPYSQEVKYLGVKLTHNLDWTSHIKDKAEKARKMIFASQNFVGKHYGLRPGLMKWVWTSIVAPIMLYGCHTWAKRLTERQKVILSKINRLASVSYTHLTLPTKA